jgi:hypothetical protein
MSSRCTVCQHADINEINRELVSHKSERSVAERYDLSATSVHRHKTSCVPLTLTRAATRAVEKEGDKLLRFAIAKRENRLEALDDRRQRMNEVIRARAEDMEDVPGGATGLLTRKYKSIGGGDHAEKVEENEVDVPLLREMRATEEQAAKELGQWAEPKSAAGRQTLVIVTPAIGAPVQRAQPAEIDLPGHQALPEAEVLEMTPLEPETPGEGSEDDTPD